MNSRHIFGIQTMLFSRCAIGLLALALLMQGCGWMKRKSLRKRAENYYEAMLYNDFDMLYDYQCGAFKERVDKSEFVRFMKDEDPEADFEKFEIDSVVVQGDTGRVRLKFEGSFLFYEDKRNVTSIWAWQKGRWCVDKDPRGRFWQRYSCWLAGQRLRRLPQLRAQMEEVVGAIEAYRMQHGDYPSSLRALGREAPVFDPHAGPGQLFRYFADGADYCILAANGPDAKPDIDVTLYRGDSEDYPPLELVYDPMTSQGDFYVYGPDKKRRRLRAW